MGKNEDLIKFKEDYSRVEASFIETLTDSSLNQLFSNIAEVGIDSILEEGLLKDIPIISTIVSLSKTGLKIREAIFVKKIIIFLKQLDELTPEERKKNIRRLENDPNFCQKVGEIFLLRLEQADDLIKPRLLGLAFLAYCRGHIEALEFQRLSAAINKLFISNKADILNFLDRKSCQYNDTLGQDFVNAGLARFVAGFDGGYIELNETGEHFGEYIFSK